MLQPSFIICNVRFYEFQIMTTLIPCSYIKSPSLLLFPPSHEDPIKRLKRFHGNVTRAIIRSYLLHMLLSFQYVMRDEVYTKWWHEKDVETYNTQARENGDNTSDMTRPHFFPRTFPRPLQENIGKKVYKQEKNCGYYVMKWQVTLKWHLRLFLDR